MEKLRISRQESDDQAKLDKLGRMAPRTYNPVIRLTKNSWYRHTLCLLLFGAAQHIAAGQMRTITWDELADVQFTQEYDTLLGFDVLRAAFGTHVTTLDGQDVQLAGFMIPLNALGTSYVLSRFPNANCFFCGGAGPETVVELRLKPGQLRRYATDTYATFRGILRLNARNSDSLTYVLSGAERAD